MKWQWQRLRKIHFWIRFKFETWIINYCGWVLKIVRPNQCLSFTWQQHWWTQNSEDWLETSILANHCTTCMPTASVMYNTLATWWQYNKTQPVCILRSDQVWVWIQGFSSPVPRESPHHLSHLHSPWFLNKNAARFSVITHGRALSREVTLVRVRRWRLLCSGRMK